MRHYKFVHLPSTTEDKSDKERLTGVYKFRYIPYGSYSVYQHARDVPYFRRIRNWKRQARPYIMTLPYDKWYWTRGPTGSCRLEVVTITNDGKREELWEGRLICNKDLEGWAWWRSEDAFSYATSCGMLDRVKNCVLKKAAGTTFNSALFAAEGHKTLDLLRSNAFKIVESFRIIRNGRWAREDPRKTAAKALQVLGVLKPKNSREAEKRSAQWLEYRYGVETLMMDVRDAAEYAASKMSDQPEQMSWSCQAETELSPFSSSLLQSDWIMGQFDTIWKPMGSTTQVRGKVKAKAWIRAEVEVAGYRSMQQAGFANPLGLAWELIPLSFVVDWVLNIGNYLEIQTALWGLRVLDAGYSLKYEGSTSVVATKPYIAPQNLLQLLSWNLAGDQSFECESERYQRWAWSNPSPTYTLGSGLNPKRVADAIALGVLAFGRK